MTEGALRLVMPGSPGGKSTRSQVALVGDLFDVLDVGVVTVDPAADVATVNCTAAQLLKIRDGDITATEFAEVISDLAARALNHTEVVGLLALLDEPAADFTSTWAFAEEPTHLGVVAKPAPYPDFAGRIWAFYDNSAVAEAVHGARDAAALVRASTDAMLDPQVLLEGVWHNGKVVDLVYRDVNRATCEYLGLSREELLGQSLLRALPNIEGSGLLAHYIRCAETGEPVILDGFPYYNEVLDDMRYYDVRGAQVRPGWMTLTWRDVTERSQWGQRVALSEQRFRLLAENMADVVALLDEDSTVRWISDSAERTFGTDAEHWLGRRALDIVPPEHRDASAAFWAKIVRAGTYIGRAEVYDADGTPHTVHLHSKPFYDDDDNPDGLVVSFRVIDDEVAAEERAQEQIAQRDAQNRNLTRRLQSQNDRLETELKSAARYVASILPAGLDGPVRVSSRFVPSRYLGGDSYDYRWVDDDHLVFYLLDVSGHGVESAMLSVSVHNLLRSGTFPLSKLLQPDAVLADLNRLFQMDQHDGNYFTMWYGAYQKSTRVLKYACAGHPPALAVVHEADRVTSTALAGTGLPIGIFEDTRFPTATYVVPPKTDILLYSDGAFELDLKAGQWDPRAFTDLCLRTAATPDWSVDRLVAELEAKTATGLLDDDCTIVRLRFD